MGLKSFLSKDGRKERAVSKAAAKAANNKIKPDDRKPALYTLAEDGGELAVEGLLTRLTYNYETNIVADEEEKHFVYETLVGMGERILPQLKEHLAKAPTLSWGLRILGEVCDRDTTWSVIEQMLRRFDPGYERDPSRKQQLLTYFNEFGDERAVAASLPFLDDHDETVRYIVIDGIFEKHYEEARDALLTILVDEAEESMRLKNRIIVGFEETGWIVKGYRGTIEKLLQQHFSDHVVDGKGRIRPKKGK